MGVYDKEKEVYKTVSKIGTGLTEEDLKYLKKKCDQIQVKNKPKNVEMDKIFTPDVFVSPKMVIEIGADEISVSPTHTAGYALRFPRLIKFRDDKNPEDTTNVSEIEKMYKNQRKNINGDEGNL